MSSPPQKRRRTTLACNSCRSRKSRCSGDKPCTLCKDQGYECAYDQVGVPVNLTVGKSYLNQLENRIQEVEASIRQLQHNPGSQASASQGRYTPEESLAAQDDAGPAPADRNASEIGEIDASENSIDGMGAIKFTDEEDCGFFGPSSNITFMRHISRAIARENANNNATVVPVDPPDQGVGGMVNVSRSRPAVDGKRGSAASDGVNIFALPTEGRTWSLIQQYFHKTGQLLPFIHQPSFCETYFQMKKDNFTKVRRTWLGLLNIVLAIATSLSTEGDMPPEKRIQESDVYYQRANGLCDRDSKRNASLEMVQYLLILGQYLQGTQKSVQAWTTHGLAISAAFQLGLHSPEANQRFPRPECEIRKRTFYGCVLLDRTLSMTFGRPCRIPESYVKLDMPLTDMQMMGYTPESETRSQLDGLFFTAAIKLYVIMFNVLDNSYGQNLGYENTLTTVDAISRVLESERQLEEWRLQLVPALGLQLWHKPMSREDVDNIDADEGSVIRNRFSVVLSVRYHNLRILLHRRFLERFLDVYWTSDASSVGGVLQQVGVSSVQNCVESAMSIISTVHTITSSTARGESGWSTSTKWRRELLGAWNYTLYYTFNAGLAIFASILISSKGPGAGAGAESIPWMGDTATSTSRPYLDLAAEALRRLDSGNRVIERCAEYLSQLSLILNTPSHLHLHPNQSPVTGTGSVAGSGNSPGNNGNNNTSANYIPMTPSTDFPTTQAGDGSPLLPNMDLGEFMMDCDLDFLGRVFSVNMGRS